MSQQPDTKRAVLWSMTARRPTRHKYVTTLQVTTKDGRGYEHIFECEDTGAQRRWGLDELRIKKEEVV